MPNVLQRDFRAAFPNRKWATDITEFSVDGQKLYLSACMDLYNGEIVAYRMAKRPVFELVSDMLKQALAGLSDASQLTVHSDQGWHYKMPPYRMLLMQAAAIQSMSHKGNCHDNAVIESFFGTLKAEYFYLKRPRALADLQAGLHDYIAYYNHERIKIGLNGLSPMDYRLNSIAHTTT